MSLTYFTRDQIRRRRERKKSLKINHTAVAECNQVAIVIFQSFLFFLVSSVADASIVSKQSRRQAQGERERV